MGRGSAGLDCPRQSKSNPGDWTTQHSRRVVVRGGGGAFWPLRQRLRRCHLPMASPQGGLFRRRWRLTKSPARLRLRLRCRSGGRDVGKEGVWTCGSRWAECTTKEKNRQI